MQLFHFWEVDSSDRMLKEERREEGKRRAFLWGNRAPIVPATGSLMNTVRLSWFLSSLPNSERVMIPKDGALWQSIFVLNLIPASVREERSFVLSSFKRIITRI